MMSLRSNQVNANGNVMSSDIVGSIKLKTMLSGMPELRLGLNDRALFALTGRKHHRASYLCRPLDQSSATGVAQGSAKSAAAWCLRRGRKSTRCMYSALHTCEIITSVYIITSLPCV